MHCWSSLHASIQNFEICCTLCLPGGRIQRKCKFQQINLCLISTITNHRHLCLAMPLTRLLIMRVLYDKSVTTVITRSTSSILVPPINAISLPLIVAVDSTNKATLTFLGTQTFSRSSSLPTTLPILLISLALPLPSSPKPSKWWRKACKNKCSFGLYPFYA